MEKVKVVLYGLGAMGSRTAKFLLEKEGAEIVGAMKDLPIPSAVLKDMRKYIHQ